MISREDSRYSMNQIDFLINIYIDPFTLKINQSIQQEAVPAELKIAI